MTTLICSIGFIVVLIILVLVAKNSGIKSEKLRALKQEFSTKIKEQERANKIISSVNNEPIESVRQWLQDRNRDQRNGL